MMTTPMEYQETQSTEAAPDVYDGPNCDQLRHRWVSDIEKEGKCDIGELLEMDAKHFPPGTKVLVLEPECPKCHQIPEFCRVDDYCDFDWDLWVADRYS